MSISIRKLGVLAVVAAVLVALAALRPTADTPVAEADLGHPGGIAALPSAVPAIPGVADQGIPAIIGTGQYAIVTVFCDDGTGALPFAAGVCADPVTFHLERLYPDSGTLPAASFDAGGTYDPDIGRKSLAVSDNSGADMDIGDGVVTVQVNAAAATLGGTQGVNEILKVCVEDDIGEARCTQIVVVDTILAWGPTGAVSTASQEQMTFVSYHCDVTGRAPVGFTGAFAEDVVEAVGGDGNQGLDDMYDGLYGPNFLAGGPGVGYGSNTLMGDADLSDVWCGGSTGGLFDDFVSFQTDKGLFSIDPGAVSLQQSSVALAFTLPFFYPPSLDYDCGEGKNIDEFDIDALSIWSSFILGGFSLSLEGGCDVDGWRNGVVTTQLLGTGEVGVATISAQQGGGVAAPRTINVTFVGEAALSLFIEAPATIGIQGDEFSVMLVDQDGRPVGDETLECTVEPADAALAIVPQTGTTGAVDSDTPGEASFDLIPTGASVLGGEELTITCVMDRDRSVSASATISLSMTPELEVVDLVEGCNPVASTWPDGTAASAAADEVLPADALDAIWKFDTASGAWQGYSPTAPADVSDLETIDMLDAIFICVDAAATWNRPVI